MLTDVTFKKTPDQMTTILELIGQGGTPTRVRRGVYVSRCFSFDHLIAEDVYEPFHEAHKRIHENGEDFNTVWEEYSNRLGGLDEYGVCDNIEQVLSRFDFEADEREFVINFVEIRRDEQPADGGWRWHKWGEYIGTQNPQYEYIHDEPEIESVFCYHVYEIVRDCNNCGKNVGAGCAAMQQHPADAGYVQPYCDGWEPKED